MVDMESESPQTNDSLTQARVSEAIAFFEVNQAARTAFERAMALFLSVAAIAGSIGVASKSKDVALPLPTLLFLMLSYMFQQYSDLTVLGVARRRLEELVNASVHGKGLIYETAVSEIRKVAPLKYSVRFLQTILGLIVTGATVFATIVAAQADSTLVTCAYIFATVVAAASAAHSYWHMLSSSKVAREKLDKQGLVDQRLVWIPSELYDQALAVSGSDELERQTFDRLIRLGLQQRRDRTS